MSGNVATRAAAYIRVSTLGQVEKWGLAAQRTALEAECARQGWEIVEWFEDAGISGETLAARPAMTQLLQRVRAAEFDVVAAVEWERFSRSRHGRDWSTILGAVEDGGARLAVPGQILDPASPDDGFLGGLFGLLSARERRKFRQRTARGMRERVAAGKWMGPRVPFGYRKIDDPASPDHGKLEPVPQDAEVVRRIFAEASEGRPWAQIARGLNADGIRTRFGGAEWRPNSVRRVIENPVHCGRIDFGRHRDRPFGGPPIVVEDAHEAIIPVHVWEQTQALVRARKNAGYPPSRHDKGFILTSLLECPDCGTRCYGTSTGRPRKKAPKRRYYGHKPLFRPGERTCRKVYADDAERLVLEQVAAALSGPDVAEAVRRQIVAERAREGSAEASRLAELQDEFAREQRKALLLYEDRVSGTITPEQFASWNVESIGRQDELRARIRRLEDAMLATGRHADVEALVATLADMPAVLEELPPAELKRLVWEVVRSVRVLSRKPLDLAVEWRLPGLGAAPESKPDGARDDRVSGGGAA